MVASSDSVADGPTPLDVSLTLHTARQVKILPSPKSGGQYASQFSTGSNTATTRKLVRAALRPHRTRTRPSCADTAPRRQLRASARVALTRRCVAGRSYPTAAAGRRRPMGRATARGRAG